MFAVTDSALFSGAFTQNARRGSLDVTGDDVYLARVLREPGEWIYVESDANPDLYGQTMIEKLDELMQAGVFDQETCGLFQEIIYRAWGTETLRCSIDTSDLTGYSGFDDWGSIQMQAENMTGKVVSLSVRSADGIGNLSGMSVKNIRNLLTAYIQYLGFDIFSDWKYYAAYSNATADEVGWNEIYAISETGDVQVSIQIMPDDCYLTAVGGEQQFERPGNEPLD